MNILALIRHAHTHYNVLGEKGRFCGRVDPQLSKRGINEAKSIREYLKEKDFNLIASSPLRRAIETAKIIKGRLSIPLIIDNRLTEIDYGVWDGLTKKEVKAKYSDEWIKFNKNPIKYYPRHGENPIDVLNRVVDVVKEVSHERCIIISHKTTLRLFLSLISGFPLENYRKFCDLKLSSVTLVSHQKGNFQIQVLNYLKHL